MRPQWLITAVGIFIFGTIFSCIASGRWLLDGEVNIITSLASFNTIQLQLAGLWTIPKGIASFVNALVTALAWDYPYLSSSWAVFVKIPLWLISIGTVWALIQVMIQVVLGIVGAARSLV